MKTKSSNYIVSARYCRLLRVGTMALTAMLLASCGTNDMNDLTAYTTQVLARKGSRIAELPPVEPYEVYAYASSGEIDPFEPFFTEQKPPPTGDKPKGNGLHPNFDRNKEELENYALDSLRMLGTLELGDGLWGIIRSPDGTIHRIQTGNYMGHNHGKIVAIYEDSIELNEIVEDGSGGWQERQAALALIEEP